MRRGNSMMLATMAMLVVTMASSTLALSNLTDHIMSMSSNDFSGIPGMTGRPNLPTNTELLVTVMADEAWVRSEGMSLEDVEDAISDALATSGSASIRMTLEFHVTNHSMMMNMTYSSNSTGIGTMNDTDTDVIVSLMSCAATHELSEQLDLLEVEHILHIGVTSPPCNRLEDDGVLIPLTKPGHEIVQLLDDFKFANTLYNWKSAVLILDEHVPSDLEQTLYEVMAPNAAISLYRLPSGAGMSEVNSVVGGLNMKLLGNRLMIVTHESLVSSFISSLKNHGKFTQETEVAIVITDMDMGNDNIDQYIAMAGEGYNLAFIYNNGDSQGSDCSGGLSCMAGDIGHIIAAAYEASLAPELPLLEQLSEPEFQLLRPKVHDRHIMVARNMKAYMETMGRCNSCVRWKMASAETKTASVVTKLDVGFWTPAGPYLKDDLFPHIKGSFRGRSIPVSSVHYPPWTVLRRDSKGKLREASGLIFEILDQISYLMNFTYIVREPADGQWGLKTGDRWSGMMGQLVNHEVILAAAPFAISPERRQAVNFSDTIDIHPYAFMYRRPEETSKALIFIDPFTPFVWFGIASMTALMGPLLWMMHKGSQYYVYHDEVNEFGLFRLSDCVWACYGALLQQGLTRDLGADSGRILIATWWLFVMVTVTTYSGSLVAFLTIPNMEWPVNNLEQLMERQEQFSWGFTAESVIETYLKDAREPIFNEVYAKAVKHPVGDIMKTSQLTPQVDPQDSLYDMILQEEHVFIEWLSHLELLSYHRYQKTKSCDYAFSREHFFYEQVAMAFPNDSPWVGRFNYELRKMLQTGLVMRWKQKYWPPPHECTASNAGGANMNIVVKIPDLIGAFFILGMGIAFALPVLGCELLFAKNKKADERHPKAFTP